MKKIVFIAIVLVSVALGSVSYAATATIHKDSGATATGALSNDGNIWNGLLSAGHYGNPRTYRGFAEFDLQIIYTLGLSSTNIISVVFKTDSARAYDYQNVGYYENLNFYSMNDNNDGVLGAYSADVTDIQTNIPYSSYINGLEIEVTGQFKDDLDANQLFSGYSIRLSNESNGVPAGTHSVLFDGDYWLEITYNAPAGASVPEPLSALLLALGVGCRFVWRRLQ